MLAVISRHWWKREPLSSQLRPGCNIYAGFQSESKNEQRSLMLMYSEIIIIIFFLMLHKAKYGHLKEGRLMVSL